MAKISLHAHSTIKMTNYKFTFPCQQHLCFFSDWYRKISEFCFKNKLNKIPRLFTSKKNVPFSAWYMIMLPSAPAPFTYINFELLANLNK